MSDNRSLLDRVMDYVDRLGGVRTDRLRQKSGSSDFGSSVGAGDSSGAIGFDDCAGDAGGDGGGDCGGDGGGGDGGGGD